MKRITLILGVIVLLAAACGSDGPASADSLDLPVVDVELADGEIVMPDWIESGGPTRLHITAGTEGEHHLLVQRADEGVTFEEIWTADEESGMAEVLRLSTYVGGNGGIGPGESIEVVVDLEPGDYYAVDLPNGEFVAEKEFEVVASGETNEEPDADWVITMGPKMTIDVPDLFDGKGTVAIDNTGGELHEAAFVRLDEGTSADDLFAWFDEQEGPPPAVVAGGGGAHSPGSRMWVAGLDLEPGDYVAICFIPDSEGLPHAFSGMYDAFTVR